MLPHHSQYLDNLQAFQKWNHCHIRRHNFVCWSSIDVYRHACIYTYIHIVMACFAKPAKEVMGEGMDWNARERIMECKHTHTHTYTHAYMHTYILHYTYVKQ